VYSVFQQHKETRRKEKPKEDEQETKTSCSQFFPLSSSLSLVLADLGRQVKACIANLEDLVLHQQGHVLGERQCDAGRQGSGLGEEVEVTQRKCQRNGLVKLHDHRLRLLVHRRSLLEGDVARPELSTGGELDTLLGAGDGDRVPDGGEVTADALELVRRHPEDGVVVGVGDAEVLAVNIHQLELVVRHTVRVRSLKDEGHGVATVLSLEGDDVVSARTLENLGHGAKVDAKRDVAVATVRIKTFSTQKLTVERKRRGKKKMVQLHLHKRESIRKQKNERMKKVHHCDERDVAAVHGLEGDSTAVAVEVGLGDQVLDGLEDLLEEASLQQTGFKHRGKKVVGC